MVSRLWFSRFSRLPSLCISPTRKVHPSSPSRGSSSTSSRRTTNWGLDENVAGTQDGVIFYKKCCSTASRSGIRMVSPSTCVIAAAASSGADPPCPFKLVVVPVAHFVALERVRGQVTDLQPGELPDEVWIGHPEQRDTYHKKECSIISQSLTYDYFPSLS